MDEDDVLQELKSKMEDYFKNHKALEKREDLDNFLEAIELLELWGSEEEKDLCWQSLNKYNKKGIIDLDAAINGIKDLINQDEEQDSHETILTHLSRRASVREPQKGKIPFAKLKQIALDEYECVDEDTLIQLKKIFSLLKITKDNNKIKFNNVQDLCSENKFIKITPEEIWKYLSFCSVDNHEGKTYLPMSIHYTLFTEIEIFLSEKVPDEENDEKIKEEEDDNEVDEDTDEDEPLDIIEKIMNNNDTIQGESKAFSDLINSLNILTNDMVDKAQNILNGDENTMDDVMFVKDLMVKKINDLNKYNKKIDKQQKANNSKMEKIQFYINKLKTDLQNLEEDYKALNDKYENHQDNINTNDDEVERLFGENLMLYQDKEAKEKEIEQLNTEKKEIEDKYNNLFAQMEKATNTNKELKNEINDIKIKNLKYKTQYEDTLEKLVNLEKVYNQKLLKQEEKKSKEQEDLNKSTDILEQFAKQQGIQNPNMNFMANKRKSQMIKFPKNISLEQVTDEEKLANYVKELEKMKEVLTERNKDSAMKIKQLETIISKNSNLTKLITTDSDPKKLLKLDEIFNPSLYEIFKERICLISDLSNFNPKKNRIVKKYSFIVGKPGEKNIILLKQNSAEINYHGIISKLKRRQTFDNNLLNVISSSNSSFNIENIKPIKVEVKKNTLEKQLTKSNFDINIKTPKKIKKFTTLENIHTDLSIISKISNIKKPNPNDYKIENVEKFIIEEVKLPEEKKESEINEDSNPKINLLFDDTSTNTNSKKSNLKFDIEKIKDTDLEESNNYMITKERSNSIMINPKELMESKDYYCLYQEEYVRRKLGHLNDICAERNIYSDQVYVLVEKKLIQKKYLLLTPSHFCILELNTLKFVYVDKIKNIKNIVISNRNLNMILFRFLDGEDLLIESLRPYDLISYMKTTYFSNIKDSIFKYEDKFIIKIKKQLHSLVVNDKILTNLQNFDGAFKIGYILMYKAKFISSNFTEAIGVLLNIGLLLFEESSLKPIALIPILGSIVKKVEKERFGNNNCFEVILPSGTTKVFAVRKTRERESWIIQIAKVKKEFDERMQKIGVVRKISTKKAVKFNV